MKNENREIQIITIRLFDINFPSGGTGVKRVTGYSSSSITARCFFIAYVRYPFSGLTL